MSGVEIHTIIERLGSLLRNDLRGVGNEFGLQPVQWDALHYLNRCNKYSDTPLAVTDYLGMTKGTVSQSIKVLESKGLIKKVLDQSDKRVIHLKVTAKGVRLLNKAIPALTLSKALNDYSPQQQDELKICMLNLLTQMQNSNDMKTFGECQSCEHFRREGSDTHCGLTGEALSVQDSLLICREHEYKVS